MNFFKSAIGISLVSLVLISGCSTETTNPTQSDVKPKETATESIQNVKWQEEIKKIALSNKTKSEKQDEVSLSLRRSFQPSDNDIKQFESDIISEYKSGRYLSNISNEEYALTIIFKAIVVEKYYDDAEQKPIDKFSYDFYQVVRDVYREVESPNGEFINANKSQLDKALSEIE